MNIEHEILYHRNCLTNFDHQNESKTSNDENETKKENHTKCNKIYFCYILIN